MIFGESLGAADNFATKHGYEIDPNQELIALGVANGGSGLLGGLAGGGSLSQSAVNEGAGARSEISPLIAAVLILILITVLVLTPLFKDLPEAVLAALIIHAVSHLWKFAEMRRYYKLQRLEFWLALATLLGVITIDVLPGLVIGVAAMLLLVIYHAADRRSDRLGGSPESPAPMARSAGIPTTTASPACSCSGSRRRCSTPTPLPFATVSRRSSAWPSRRRTRSSSTSAAMNALTSPVPRCSPGSSTPCTRPVSTSRSPTFASL